MARYSQAEMNQMRKDAMRRSKQMHHGRRDYSFLPLREDIHSNSNQTCDKAVIPKQPEKTMHSSQDSKKPPSKGFKLGSFDPKELLQHLDSEKMMIIAMLVVLYNDGADNKLLMALAYLLI